MLSQSQIDAMDDTMGHHAQAYAKANLHLLEDKCGIVESREATLMRRIGTRQGLIVSGPLTESKRREYEEQNELDAQELALIEGERAAEAGPLARSLFWIGISILSIVSAWHLVAMNWGVQ